MTIKLLEPDWPAPKGVRAFSSTRVGGVSSDSFAGLNVGKHVGDAPERVAHNRKLLPIHERIVWLNQVHGIVNIELTHMPENPPEADAAYTKSANIVCAVMTADCLPILITNRSGTMIAAIHAGWRGLCEGVIEQQISVFDKADSLLCWLGPTISAEQFEVGEEVLERFCRQDEKAEAAFLAKGKNKYSADLTFLAKQRLNKLGVTEIWGGSYCTYSNPDLFYSYRRDGQTGRMVSCIWME